MSLEHCVQLRHHCSVLAFFYGLYDKSSVFSIIYSVLVIYDVEVLENHRPELLQIVDPHISFIYQRRLHFIVPFVSDNNYRHAQEKDGFVYTIRMWRSIDAHIRRN